LFFLFEALFLSALRGFNFSRSFWGTMERMDGLFTQLHLFAMFLVLTGVFKRRKDWINILKFVVFLSIPLFIAAILQRGKIFAFFSKESKRHFNILKKVLNYEKYISYNPKIYYISINFFYEINNLKFNKITGQNTTHIINEAIKYKKESQKFYLKKTINIKHEKIKDLFLHFADEEYNHYTLLEQILKNINKNKIQKNTNIFTNQRTDAYLLNKVS